MVPWTMRPTDLSLLEKMNMSDREIARRKHLFDLTDADSARLRPIVEFVRGRIVEVMEAYYDGQLENPELAQIISDAETLRRLRVRLAEYVITAFSGPYDADYFNGRLRIGQVHRRIGISPRLYMAGLRSLQTMLDGEIDAWGQEEDIRPADVSEAKISIHKVLLFDSQLVFDAYVEGFMSEVDNVKSEIAAFASGLAFKAESTTRDLIEISSKDGLTGLYNQRTFYDFLGHEIATAQRYKLPLSLAYIDLNDFKGVNDTFGHQAGDAVLARVAEAMLYTVRKVDVPCRYGGDEFCILFPRTDRAAASKVCQRLIAHFHDICGHDVSLSVGLAQTDPGQVMDAEALLSAADKMMYEAKDRHRHNGGDQISVDKYMNASLVAAG